MPIFSSTEWWREMDDEATLTRKMRPDVFVSSSWDEITSIEVSAAHEPEVTPVFSRAPSDAATPPYATERPAPLGSVTEVDAVPYGAMPSLPDYASSPELATRVAPPPRISAPAQPLGPFLPARPEARSLPEMAVPKMRLPFDSEVSTWKKTVPALRRLLKLRNGVPLDPRALGSVPPPAVTDTPARREQWSPFIMLAVAVSLVAMVIMSVVGFTSRAAEAARAARTRVVSASGPGGGLLDDGKVFVDGAVQCEALPCELELADGEHWVTVRAKGFETPPSRSVSVGDEGPSRVHFELTPLAGGPSAPIAAEPPAAPRGPVVPVALTARPAPESAPAPSPAPVRSRPMVRSFAPRTGRLNINAIPAAAVVVDGRPRGQTPVMGLRLKAGRHTVVLVFPNGRRVVRGTVVRPGASAVVAARL